MKVFFFQRRALLRLLAMSAALCTLFLVFLLHHASQVRDPASQLPASDTLALFTELSTEERAAYARWFPVLLDTPSCGDDAVALLRSGSNTPTWVAMDMPPLAKQCPLPPNAHRMIIDGLVITAPKSDVFPLLASHEKRLSSLSAFRRLKTRFGPGQPWVFLDLQPLVADSPPLSSLFGPHPYAALLHREQIWSIALTREGGWEAHAGVPTTLPLTAEHPLLAIRSAHLETDANVLLSLLSPTEREAALGLLERRTEELLGPEVSARYDLLPFVRDAIALNVRRTASGAHAILIEGTWQGAQEDAAKRFDLLQERFARSLQPFLSTRRSLDRSFSSIILREGRQEIHQKQVSVGGWEVRTTEDRSGGRALATALRGSQFLLSTDPGWLKEYGENGLLHSEQGQPPLLPLFLGHGTVLAEGEADLAFLNAMLQTLPFRLYPDLLPPLTGAGNIRWRVEDMGAVRVLTLRLPLDELGGAQGQQSGPLAAQ